MTFTDERDESSQLLSPFHPKFKNMQNIKHNNNYNYTLVTNGSGRGILGVPIDSDSAITTTDNTQSTSTTTTVSSTTPLLPKPDADTRMGRIARRIPALGIIMAFMSVLCYSLGSAIVNLMPELHSLEILMIRSIFQFVTFGTLVIIKGYSIAPAEGHKSTLALRIISGTITLTTVFVAYRLMPLADASTIQFSSPVFVAIFAYFMLRESINCIQGVAGLVTLAGVVVIAQPEFIFGAQSSLVYDQRLLGTTLAVVSSISGAFSMITLRKLKTTPVPVIVTWYGLAVSIVGLIILLALNELTLPQGCK
ncbi:unnamed protein product [Oppiella nova]|uniref:EamA domain-containing protein n=1 Tax=Oppiella nova TaxID=334625 RepID=A0A7R9M440_9ACAR|nr:unnamed protein product [Oppiella nova]CAG2170306.1 unnamed protein product [Oppiella nova]